MRWLSASALLALLLLATAPTGMAAINKPLPLHADYGYMTGLDANGPMAIVSGALDATLAPAPGAFGFFDARGLTVTGLDRVCYSTSRPCEDGPGGTLSIQVSEAGSFALCFPSRPGAQLEAQHALAMFVDFSAADDLNTFLADKSIVAPAVDGVLAFGPISAIPTSALNGASAFAAPCSASAGLSALDSSTVLTLRKGTTVVATLSGKTQPVLFTGQPVVPTVAASFVIAPFGDAATAHFSPAASAAAREGLDIGRVQELIQKVDASSASSTTQRTQTGTGANAAKDALADLLNGALVGLPNGIGDSTTVPAKDLQFARFTTLAVGGTPTTLTWEGKSTLEIKDGKVTGAQKLVGFGPVQFPWWTYVLWVAALALFITRLALKPDKTHPTWDRFKWVGWVAGILAAALALWLWDGEIKAVFGISFLQGATGQARLVIGAIEASLLSLFALLAALPLRIALRNTFLLSRQGTFMGIAGAVATLLGFVLSALALRSVLGLIVDQVIQRLA